MYLLKSGMMRIYTHRGNATVEIATIRAGQVVGELAFLDGNPRSLSCEAISDCELVEISGSGFSEVLSRSPEWMKILLKTIVNRLRAANVRIRQLESTTGKLDYSDKIAGLKSSYQYMGYPEFLKTASAVLLVASNYGKKEGKETRFESSLLNRYAHSIFGVPHSKVTSTVEILMSAHILRYAADQSDPILSLIDKTALESTIDFLYIENSIDTTNQKRLSKQGIVAMKSIMTCLSAAPAGLGERYTVDLVSIREAASVNGEQEALRTEAFAELKRQGHLIELSLETEEEAFVILDRRTFPAAFRAMQIVYQIGVLNEQKRELSRPLR